MDNRPNILLITSDQHRADALGCAGHPCVRTPHLDALAYAGVRFSNAYSNCPLCMPARTSIITGRDAHINGSTYNTEKFKIRRSKDEYLGGLITKAGYQTQLIGKTHWHTEPTFRGGFESVIRTEYPPNLLWKDRLLKTGRDTLMTGIGANEINPTMSLLPPELNSSQWIVDRCLEFIDLRDRTAPFFLWASFLEPHPPNVIHEPYYSMYDKSEIPEPVYPEWAKDENIPYAMYVHRIRHNPGPMKADELRKARAVYYGNITHLDHQLGRLMGKLIKEGLWDNTVIIYTSDHGEQLGDFGDIAKSSFTEASAKIPFIIKPPQGLEVNCRNESDALVELTDILPTLCDIAGVEVPHDVSGKSLIGFISGKGGKVREFVHGNIEGSHMYHDGRYKYLYFIEDGIELLFDVKNDKNDIHDLSGDRSLLKVMRERFTDHLEKEGHEHLIDGKLLNRGLKKPSAAQLRAEAIKYLGLGWAGRGYCK